MPKKKRLRGVGSKEQRQYERDSGLPGRSV